MAITKKQEEIAKLLKSQFQGDFTTEEIFIDTLTGAITWLTSFSKYEAYMNGKNHEHITAETTTWCIINILMRNLPPQKDIDSRLKWYISLYEGLTFGCWKVIEMLMNHIKDNIGKESLLEIRQKRDFSDICTKNEMLEKMISNRLKIDGLEALEKKIWGEEV